MKQSCLCCIIDSDETGMNTEKNYVEVTPDTGWGFCTTDCRSKV